MKEKQYIKGKQCCWRCGMSKKDVSLSKHLCYVGYQTYHRHLWLIDKESENETDRLR